MSIESLSPLLGPEADPVEAGMALRKLGSDAELDPLHLLAELINQQSVVAKSDRAILGALLRLIHLRVVEKGSELFAKLDPDAIIQLHQMLPEDTPNQHLLLQLLSRQGSEAGLAALIERLSTHPPKEWIDAGQILGPLMQREGWSVETVFPDILQCLSSPSLAAPVLDLANFVTRKKLVDEHPATERLAVLNHLLGEVSNRLAKFEEDAHAFGDDVETVQTRLGEAVALAVSLCDAVGLIGDESSIGKLNQTIELRHRRVQCEAAGALAMLGDDLGKKRLLDLSADPAARLRAIQYADELGFGEAVDEKYRTEQATAESELALWLTQPQQMGVPPTGIEVIETRRMIWPSFSDPIDVFLVRFEYNFGDRQYSNVGVVGPISFAISADVADLPHDDIYAVYAGWHAEHDEIFTVPANQMNEAQHRLVAPFIDHLNRSGYESVKVELLGFFLDEQAGVFRAIRDETECLVVTDGLETVDQPTAGRLRPFDAGDLFNLYKGRKMLRTFNA